MQKKPILAEMNKTSKKILYLFLLLLIIILAVSFGTRPIIKKIISEKVENVRLGGIYKISFKTAYFNIFQMGITVKQLKITPDSTGDCAKLIKHQKYLAEVKIKKVNINHIDVFRFMKDKKISIKDIKIRKPLVQLYKNNHYSAAKTPNKNNDNSLSVKEIQLNDISINNLKLNVYIDDDKVVDLMLDDVDLELVDPLIDFAKLKTPLKAISVSDILFSVSDILYKDKKGLYETSLESLEYKHKSNEMILEDFHLKPLYNNIDFAKQFKYQSNRYDISIKDITLRNIDFDKLANNKIIAVNQLEINEIFFNAYRNKNYPLNTNKFPKLPQAALRSIKQKFEINEIKINSSDIIYMETAENADKAGKIGFTDLGITIKNIGNTKAWQKKKKLTANAHTLVAGKGKLNVSFNFPLNSNTFYISGNLGQMNMTAFNTITEPNANIKIQSGHIQKMNFSAHFNNQVSGGEMKLYYDDLSFSIFKENSKSGKKRKRKLLNFVAKSFIIADANPNKKGEFRTAEMAFERDKNKGLFAYIWKTLFSGFKDTIRHKK